VSQNGWFFSSITRLYEQKHDKTSNSVSWVYLTSTISVNYHPHKMHYYVYLEERSGDDVYEIVDIH
jgi:hypothetical protein